MHTYTIGYINKDIYKCITNEILSNEVIITDERIQHIMEHHPDSFDTVIKFLNDTVSSPDYIFEDDKNKNTGLVIKQLQKQKTGYITLVIKICTQQDNLDYKNSIISCWQISDKRLANYIRHKKYFTKKNKLRIILVSYK